MKINLNLTGQSPALNVTTINRKYKTSEEQDGYAAQGAVAFGRVDSVAISGKGRKESMIQQLMNQKDLIQENKNAILQNSLENGSPIDQNKLEEYEEKLKSIDEQIAQIMAEETVDETKDSTEKTPEEVSEEEYQSRRMSDIAGGAALAEQSELIMSVKGRMEKEVGVLEAQIKTGYGVLESKHKRIAEIKERVSKLEEEAGKKQEEARKTADSEDMDVADPDEDEKMNTYMNI